MILKQLFTALLLILFGLAFFWLIILKIVSRLANRLGIASPCPTSFAWLVDNPLRKRYMHSVLDWVGIQPGEHILELGPGPGLFTIEAARRSEPGGSLIAVDIQPEMIARLDARIRHAGVTNVKTHVASAYELPLPDASIDHAFLVTVLGEIPDPRRALTELHRVLKPGGILSITEEFIDPDYPFACETIRRVESAGFRLAKRAGNFWVYTLNFVSN